MGSATAQHLQNITQLRVGLLWTRNGIGDGFAKNLPESLAQPMNRHARHAFGDSQSHGNLRVRDGSALGRQIGLELLQLERFSSQRVFLIQTAGSLVKQSQGPAPVIKAIGSSGISAFLLEQ